MGHAGDNEGKTDNPSERMDTASKRQVVGGIDKYKGGETSLFMTIIYPKEKNLGVYRRDSPYNINWRTLVRDLKGFKLIKDGAHNW